MSSDHSGIEPPGTDIDGWRRILAENRLAELRKEDIVAGLQDLGPDADSRVINPLMGYLSDELLKFMRRRVAPTYRNGGEDIIEDAHEQIINAVLQPSSADGKGLRVAFWARVKARLIDAIRREIKSARRSVADGEAELEKASSDETGGGEDRNDPSDLHGNLYVEELLSHVKDPLKLLAFRLDMEEVPIESTKGSFSIVAATGRSAPTVRKWLAEIRELLKSKVGERA